MLWRPCRHHVRRWRTDASATRGFGGVGRLPRLKNHMVRTIKNRFVWLTITIQMTTTTTSDLDTLIAAAKRDVYTPRHGETISPSPTGKENENGAR